MIKLMKLKGYVRNEGNLLVFCSKIHDGSEFSVQVREHDVQLNRPFAPDTDRVEGWLFVQQEAKQDSRVYITLPHPSLQYGHHILVHELQLMPHNATLSDFGQQTAKK